MIFEKYPELKEDTAMNVMLSYCIQGSYHAYQKNRSGDIMTVIDVIAGMTGAIDRCMKNDWGKADHESGTAVYPHFGAESGGIYIKTWRY